MVSKNKFLLFSTIWFILSNAEINGGLFDIVKEKWNQFKFSMQSRSQQINKKDKFLEQKIERLESLKKIRALGHSRQDLVELTKKKYHIPNKADLEKI